LTDIPKYPNAGGHYRAMRVSATAMTPSLARRWRVAIAVILVEKAEAKLLVVMVDSVVTRVLERRRKSRCGSASPQDGLTSTKSAVLVVQPPQPSL
jgi:hypothetical protein